MYAVEASQRAQKFLAKLDQNLRERIEERLKRLGVITVPSDAKFISRDDKGNKIFRYRIGNYRALYLIKDEENLILIVKIDKRSKVYD